MVDDVAVEYVVDVFGRVVDVVEVVVDVFVEVVVDVVEYVVEVVGVVVSVEFSMILSFPRLMHPVNKNRTVNTKNLFILV